MRASHTFKLTVSLAALGAVCIPVSAFAQVDEVITTAQRRVETAQDVPVALTVVTAEDLQVKQIEDTLDLASFVPNLNLGTNTGTANAARIFLRGIGEDESRGAVEPAVGTYVDGVYIGRIVGALFDLVDLEQVEVLRGPQGTLYGRNSNGGAIKLTSVRPNPDAFEGNARVTVGNNDRLDLKGTLNLPIGPNTALRVSGLKKDRDGFFTINPRGPGFENARYDNVGQLDTLAFRGSLLHEMGDWSLLVIGDYTDDDSDPIPSTIIDDIDADGDLFTVEPAPGTACFNDGRTEPTAPAGPFQFTRPVGCFAGFSNVTENRGISATVTGDVGGFQLQSITAFRKLDDNLSSHIGFPYLQQTDQEQISQEVTFSSDFEGPFNFVSGVYYFKEDLNLDTAFVFPFRVATDLESWAVFGQGEFEVGDFTLTGGLRYTDEDREFEGINFASGLNNNADVNSDNVSYTAKVDYDVRDDLLVYGSYSTGFKGAGFSPDCFSPTACFLPVTEEEVATFEVGFKSRLLDDRVRFNGTYFNNQYDDLQIAATVPGLGFTRFNADETEIQGLEFEGTFAPNARFELTANLGLLDGEYQSLTELQAQSLLGDFGAANCPGGVASVACAQELELKNAPDYKLNVAAVFMQPFWEGDLVFSGDITFEDESFSLVANAPFNALSDVPTLVNARVAYQPEGEGWYLAAWARNLTDQEYFRAATATANAVYASEPATYGIDLGYRF